MPTHGIIDDVEYRLQKWCIRNLAYEYKIRKDGQSVTVYIDNLKDLRHKIAEFLLEFEY